jgi:hypothetical protein
MEGLFKHGMQPVQSFLPVISLFYQFQTPEECICDSGSQLIAGVYGSFPSAIPSR